MAAGRTTVFSANGLGSKAAPLRGYGATPYLIRVKMRKINVVVPVKPSLAGCRKTRFSTPCQARSAEGVGDIHPVGGQLGRVVQQIAPGRSGQHPPFQVKDAAVPAGAGQSPLLGQ